MWQPGKAIATRTDALQYAALKMLEQFREMLDGPATIKGVTLDLKITPERTVRTALLSPEFETHAGQLNRPKIEQYDFDEKSLLSDKPIVIIK